MSTPKPPQERICIGGVDGSPSCGHGEGTFDAEGCTFFQRSYGTCGHACTFAQEPTPQRHEFVAPPFDVTDGLCRRIVPSSAEYIANGGSKFRCCYEAQDAEIHGVEAQEPRYRAVFWQDNAYRDPICRNCGEYKGKHSKGELFCPRDPLGSAATASPAQPAPPERPWNLAQYPGDGRTSLEIGDTLKVIEIHPNVTDLHWGKCVTYDLVRSDSEAPLTVEQVDEVEKAHGSRC